MQVDLGTVLYEVDSVVTLQVVLVYLAHWGLSAYVRLPLVGTPYTYHDVGLCEASVPCGVLVWRVSVPKALVGLVQKHTRYVFQLGPTLEELCYTCDVVDGVSACLGCHQLHVVYDYDGRPLA